MTTSMLISLLVALVAAVLYFVTPKGQALTGYAFLAGLLVFLLAISGKAVHCSI